MAEAQQQAQARPPAAGTLRAPWWSSSAAQTLILAAALLLLEALPLEAWLLVFTGAEGLPAGRTPLPVWLMVGALGLAWYVGRRSRGRGKAILVALAVPLFFVTLMALFRFSPAAEGDVPGGIVDTTWLNALGAEFANGTSRLGAMFWLSLLLVALWRRGILLGTDTPAYHEVLRHFKWGTIATVGAIIVAVLVPSGPRVSLVGALGFLLPFEVFAGLLACALIRVALHRSRSDDGGAAGNDATWMGMALVSAGVVVVFAIILGFVINYSSVSALLQQLGPVGLALDAALRWVLEGFAQLLYLLFNGPVEALKHYYTQHPPQRTSTPQPTCSSANCNSKASGPSAFVLVAYGIFYGTICSLAVVAVVLIVRSILRRLAQYLRGGRAFETAGEVRESLDAGALFRGQLRTFLDGLLGPSGPAEELLPQGSVRHLYREVLRAGARSGLARERAETPDEYAARVGQAAPLALEGGGPATDLAELSAAYDAARYGEREPEQAAQISLHQRTARIIARLSGGRSRQSR
jgi:hypothetical protein